ncbi:PA2779 family protein [Desulfospira joergensenii]|uniref:PA2779 family protein n=1 Tax=Desulfospira joergensenii TaxID=53329 RepID=UPI0003B79225|nr:PA2779 family protein [Desulfospira joergensenii]
MKKMVKIFPMTLFISVFVLTSIMLPAAQAKVIGTGEYLQQQNHSARSDVDAFMARDDVRKQLVEMGVNPDDAAKRIANLSDAEINQLQKSIDDLPAGSNVFAVLGVVLVVLIVLELVGVTDIFTRM